MSSRRIAFLVSLAVGTLLSAPAALARDDDPAIRLTGGVTLGPALDAFDLDVPNVIPAAQSADATPAEEARRTPVRAPALIEDEGSATALRWYERFTVAPSETRSVWGGTEQAFQLEAGDRWGVILGYTEQQGRGPQSVDLEDFSAGAFIEFSDRFRFGGQVRFTSPEEEIFGEEGEERTPEIRFESAFRF